MWEEIKLLAKKAKNVPLFFAFSVTDSIRNVTGMSSFFFPQVSGGGHHFLLPHDPLTLFLYCFIFIHLIYIAKELIFFFFKKHGMFAIGAVLIFAIKIFWN